MIIGVIKTIVLLAVGAVIGIIVGGLLGLANAYRREHDEWRDD